MKMKFCRAGPNDQTHLLQLENVFALKHHDFTQNDHSFGQSEWEEQKNDENLSQFSAAEHNIYPFHSLTRARLWFSNMLQITIKIFSSFHSTAAKIQTDHNEMETMATTIAASSRNADSSDDENLFERYTFSTVNGGKSWIIAIARDTRAKKASTELNVSVCEMDRKGKCDFWSMNSMQCDDTIVSSTNQK